MKITRKQLRRLINEQINLITEEVTLTDLGRNKTKYNGTPYPEAGAVVVLGKDNPGLFYNDDKFYKDEERLDPKDPEEKKKITVRVLKKPNTFKKQDGSSIEGSVIDFLKSKDAAIVVPAK